MYLMRRLISLITVLAAISSSTQVFAVTYSDVSGTRFGEAVAYLSSRQVVKGYDDGSIRPNAKVNRAEALKLVLMAHEDLKPRLVYHISHPARMPLFKDVKSTDWYVSYVEAGFTTGLAKGYSDGTFRAGNQVTLAEAVAMISRAQKSTSAITNPWYDAYMNDAKSKNLLSRQEKNWSPGMVLTRGQLIDILYRAHVVRTQKLVAFNDPEPVIAAVPTSTVAYEAVPGRAYVSSPARTYISSPTRTITPATRSYATATTTTSTTPAASQSFTISIPALGISNMTVTHPRDPTSQAGLLSVLKNGVGHLYAIPGGNGKILIYGHSSSYSYDTSSYTKIFRTINKLKPGDKVNITYGGKLFTYEVTGQQQIRPNDTSAFSGQGEELILYTCWPPDSIDTRLLVRAKRVH